jgi:dihydrofolate reductase
VSRTRYYCAASLDGYIAETDGGLEWLAGFEGAYDGTEAEAGPTESYEHFYDGVGALVSGSATYEYVLEHVGPGGEWPYAGRPWWVLSSRDLPTPDRADADVRVTDSPIPGLHAEMLAAAGDGNLWIVGGGGVASRFANAGLLDDVLVTIVPVVLGAGRPLFGERLEPGALTLTGTTTFSNGMVELRYAVGGPGEGEAAG